MKLPVTVKEDSLSLSQDYLFQSNLSGGYNLLINCNLRAVIIQNNSDEPKKILKKTRLGVLTKIDETNIYTAYNKDSDLVYKPNITTNIIVSRPNDLTLKTSINFSITMYRKSEIVQHI